MTARLRLLGAVLPLALAACATTGGGSASSGAPADALARKPVDATPAEGIAPTPRRASPYAPAQEDLSKRGDYVAGGLFRPGVADTVPDEIPDVDLIPEPEVRDEPRARTGNRAYTVLGTKYRVLDDHEGYAEEGGASYYGKKFHGRRTSSGEVYDMYAFSAAHKSLPLPSFARVTNLDNGKSIVVRVNDRGPFHKGRIIDLSYAAAVKLGYRERGVARVRVEALSADGKGTTTTLASATSTAATEMDKLVQGLPAATPVVDNGHRFDMRRDGRTMGADEFDAWMRARQIRVATGKPAPVPASASTTAVAAAPVAAPAPPVATATPAADGITLQVASFSNQRNAEQALSLLRGAAIAQAQLQDADINGRKVWRLRIGPVSEAATPELAARIVGLGFGQPQRIRN